MVAIIIKHKISIPERSRRVLFGCGGVGDGQWDMTHTSRCLSCSPDTFHF